MNHVCNANCEHKLRLDAAITALDESSRRLMESVFSGPDEAIESAYTSLRVAKVRFSSARAICRDLCQLAC